MLSELLEDFESLKSNTSKFGMDSLRDSFESVDGALESVESVLGSLRSWEAPLAAEVAGHLVTAGGKRLRPALLFLTYRGAGGKDLSKAKPYAVACELIHTSTLLHDDVIDQGNQRRGVEAAHRRFGNLNAVLSGDYLVAHVMQKLLSLGRIEPARHLSIVMTQLVQGEILQEEFSYNPDIKIDQYIRMTKLKTSSLFSYGAWCGAYLVEEKNIEPKHYARYAEHLGIAFQIVDDVLDYQSHSTGKTPLSDLREGKINFPFILAMEEDSSLKEEIQNWDDNQFSTSQLRNLSSRVRETSALQRARKQAKKHSSLARACLEEVDSNSYIKALGKISEFVHQRIQ